MRTRILRVAVVAVAVAVVLLATPLAVATHQLFVSEEHGRLERSALTAAVAIDPDDLTGSAGATHLPRQPEGHTIALYDSGGRLLDGQGPARADLPVRAALQGEVGKHDDGDELVVAVPIPSGDSVVGVVRAGTAPSVVWRRTLLAWTGLLLLAGIAVAVAGSVAQRQARRLSRPLQDLAAVAQELGEGDFTVRTRQSGVDEIDRAATALDVTAYRLGLLVSRERAFAGNASHQLRTPLTGLRLRLEQALGRSDGELRVAAREALSSAERLETTIDDLLELERERSTPVGDPARPEALVAALRERWEPELAAADRALSIEVEPTAPSVDAPARVVGHALDVLVDNALRHGSGTVTVLARDAGGALALDVEDEGPGVALPEALLFRRGVSGADGHGIGLAMAREVIETLGGRLLLARATPSARFTVLLPEAGGSADEAFTGP